MSLEIIGAGFGRTGTMSMKAALERLGYGKCYHMIDMFQNPDDVHLWDQAARGAEIDWDGLLSGYRSTSDWPGAFYYKTLMDHYPHAKVILTTRDPERWYESVDATIYKVISTVVDNPQPWRALHERIMWEGTFHGKFKDKQYAIRVFEQHIEDVKAYVSKPRLLVYSVKQGWEPLCRFIGVDVPDEPFPHLNDRESFEQIAARLNNGAASTAAHQ